MRGDPTIFVGCKHPVSVHRQQPDDNDITIIGSLHSGISLSFSKLYLLNSSIQLHKHPLVLPQEFYLLSITNQLEISRYRLKSTIKEITQIVLNHKPDSMSLQHLDLNQESLLPDRWHYSFFPREMPVDLSMEFLPFCTLQDPSSFQIGNTILQTKF